MMGSQWALTLKKSTFSIYISMISMIVYCRRKQIGDGNALERPRGHDVEYIMAHVTRYLENDWKVQDTAYGWD